MTHLNMSHHFTTCYVTPKHSKALHNTPNYTTSCQSTSQYATSHHNTAICCMFSLLITWANNMPQNVLMYHVTSEYTAVWYDKSHHVATHHNTLRNITPRHNTQLCGTTSHTMSQHTIQHATKHHVTPEHTAVRYSKSYHVTAHSNFSSWFSQCDWYPPPSLSLHLPIALFYHFIYTTHNIGECITNRLRSPWWRRTVIRKTQKMAKVFFWIWWCDHVKTEPFQFKLLERLGKTSYSAHLSNDKYLGGLIIPPLRVANVSRHHMGRPAKGIKTGFYEKQSYFFSVKCSSRWKTSVQPDIICWKASFLWNFHQTILPVEVWRDFSLCNCRRGK